MIRRWRERRPTGDAGTTLLELVVGMTIMSIFLAVFTGAIVLMTSTVNKVEAISVANSQTNNAFLALDKTVRYASAITTIGVSPTSNDWYVEFDSTNTSVDVCTQLRVDITARQLQKRTWVVPATGTPVATGWTPLASNVTNGSAAAGSADVPFSTPAALTTATTSFQRLTIALISTSATATTNTSRSVMTFTAMNSSAAATTNSSKCQQMGRP